MGVDLDGKLIEVCCPNCRYKSRKTVGWLRTHNEMTCISCGTRVTLGSSS